MKQTCRVIGLAALSLLFSLGSVPTASATSMVTIVVSGVDFHFDGSQITDISPSPGSGNGAPDQSNAASVGYFGVAAPPQTAGVYMDIYLPIAGGIALPAAGGTTTVNVTSGGIFHLLLPNEDSTACSSSCWGLALEVTSYTVSYTDLGTVEVTFTAGLTSDIFFQDLPGFSIHRPVTFTLSGAVASSTNDGAFLNSFVVSNGVATFHAPVPEPGMTLLLGLGLVGAGIIARKRGK